MSRTLRPVMIIILVVVLAGSAVGWWAVHADWRSQKYNGTVTKSSGFLSPVIINKVTYWYYHSDLTITTATGQAVNISVTTLSFVNPWSVGEAVCLTHSNAVGWSVEPGRC